MCAQDEDTRLAAASLRGSEAHEAAERSLRCSSVEAAQRDLATRTALLTRAADVTAASRHAERATRLQQLGNACCELDRCCLRSMLDAGGS